MLEFLIKWWHEKQNEQLIMRAVKKELSETDFLVFLEEAERDFLWVRKPVLKIVGSTINGGQWLLISISVPIAGKTVEQVLADLPRHLAKLEKKMKGFGKFGELEWVED